MSQLLFSYPEICPLKISLKSINNFFSELKAYRGVVDALRAQGALTKNKYEVLKSLADTLKVGEERSRSEIRRAVNNSLLTSIAERYILLYRLLVYLDCTLTI